MNKTFTIPMDYYYKGSFNGYVHLRKNDFDNIELRTDYGEFVGVYSGADTLCKAIADLSDGKYAE